MKPARLINSFLGINAMAGGQITYEFGYCPYNYAPLCCAVVVSYSGESLQS